jgi:hypothetical protein
MTPTKQEFAVFLCLLPLPAVAENFADTWGTAEREAAYYRIVDIPVPTEKYWVPKLKAARGKEEKIKQRAKKLAQEGSLKPAEEKAALEKLRAEGLTEHERLVLEKGVSNAEFHYLGSAKILGGIGQGLAEAMAELKGLMPAK